MDTALKDQGEKIDRMGEQNEALQQSVTRLIDHVQTLEVLLQRHGAEIPPRPKIAET